MGIFDFLKKDKNKAGYDPLNVKVTDLKTGFLFDYDLATWEVIESYEYDWGNNFFSWEYKVQSSDKIRFLEVEEDDELRIVMYTPIKIRAIDEDLPEYIQKHDYPPKSLTYKGTKFLKDEENPGYFRKMDEKDSPWAEVISWEYADENDEQILAVEQWGEREFEAAIGKLVPTYEISNIIPAESQTK